ncbi:MAG: glycosyltransferase family 4 protein [Planctomycetota bacterium]|nr:glycosyltransferase family 4 protein [Planctomycetota bacterium]
MRVLLVSTHFIHYGMELANGLIAQGVEVGLVFHAENARQQMGEDYGKILDSKVKILHPPGKHTSKPWTCSAWKNIRWFPRICREFKPDVIHLQATNDFASLWTAWKTSFSMTVTIHDVTAHPGDEKHQTPLFLAVVKKLLIPRAIRRGIQFITHGEILRQALAKEMALPLEKIHSVAHGVLRFSETPSPEASAVAPLPATPMALFFGRMEKYKGLHVLVDAIPLVQKQYPQATFVIAGRGPALLEQKETLRALPQVQVMDHYLSQEEVDTLYRRASINLVPYVEASQSGVIATGFAYGVPAVASNIGALSEVVVPGENGCLVEPGNAQDLADAILSVFQNQEKLQSLRQGAVAWAKGPLNWETLAGQTASVYEMAISAKAKSTPPR